jgi:predicted small secreted protein
MYTENSNFFGGVLMRIGWKSFTLGAVAGAAGALFAQKAVTSSPTVAAEKVLARVKEAFNKEGIIEGSWIQMKPEQYQKLGIDTTVYKGGISRRRDGELEQYEFIADASTGTIMDVYRLS